MNAFKVRIIASFDAISQWMNVTFLPRIKDTNSNESISGRSYREGVVWKIKFIDFIFSWMESEHCRKSFEADYERARNYVNDNVELFKNPKNY
jgi:hypothetical protein